MTRTYDRDGFRHIRPSERSPGMTELRLSGDRCIQCVGFGPAIDASLLAAARARGAGA